MFDTDEEAPSQVSTDIPMSQAQLGAPQNDLDTRHSQGQVPQDQEMTDGMS